MRLSNEATESCTEQPRGRDTSSQASSIIVITSKGAVRRQDLRYVQSFMCYIYDIMTFLVTHKKPSHFHSELSHTINAKHLSSTQVQCNALKCALIKRYNGIEQKQILRSSAKILATVCQVMHEQMGYRSENDTTMLMPAISKDQWQLFRLFLRPFMALSSQSSVSHDT